LSNKQVSLVDILNAEKRIRKYVRETPLEYSRYLSRITGREVYLKLENNSAIRVFKIRGAFNKILSMGRERQGRGVITASSGNHGLAVAYAAKVLGLKAVICVPDNVNRQKLEAIEEQSAEIIKYGKNYDNAYIKAKKIASSRGLEFVHAFDDRDVIAGQGTCGLEITKNMKELDAVFVPVGGGGLIAGISVAVKSLKHSTVFGVQTEAVHSMYTSLNKGRIVSVEPKETIADGMIALKPGKLTFSIASKFVDRILLVDDEEIRKAVYMLLRKERIVSEPAGASPLAALLSNRIPESARKIVLVISGGNISLDLLEEILERYHHIPIGAT
jgi:threonine dehydratase